MPKNDKARKKNVEAAANALMQFTGIKMKVREVMDFLQFSKKEINDVNVCHIVARQLFRAMQAVAPTLTVHIEAETSIYLSLLSSDNGSARAATTAAIPVAAVIPPPKRKIQRMTTCVLVKKRVEDMKQKKHRSDAHKEALCLYVQEKIEPNGLSLRQVQEKIMKNIQ